MRFPHHLFQLSVIKHEPYMAAMAVVAVGMFVGAWVIGPLMSRDDGSAATPPVKQERLSIEEMKARPDPSPYRSATPAFDMANSPNYAAAAKEKARAEALDSDGGEFAEPAPAPSRGSSRYYRTYDRHRVD